MSRHQTKINVTTLPALRHEDTGPHDTAVAQLEDRLAQQERTTRSLHGHAFRIKDDDKGTLGSARGLWQSEAEARPLLLEHVQAISDVVRKLSRDIQFLDAQIKERDGANLGLQQVVKSIELHHVAGVTDLRARVVRCDSSIAQLATNLNAAFETIYTVARKQHEQQSQVIEMLHQLESKIQANERLNSENSMQLQHVDLAGSAQPLICGIDIKSRVDELEANLQAFQSIEQTEREKLEARIMLHIDQTLVLREAKLGKLKAKREKDLTELIRLVSQLDGELSKDKERIANIDRVLQNQSQSNNIESIIARQTDELARLKRDLREGFDAVRQSIEDMKEVVEVRRQLMEERVHKEFLQMRKMIALV